MSKSNGAILTVSLLEKNGYDPIAFRFMCLNSHYRKQLVFSYDALDQATTTLQKLKKRIFSLGNEGEISQEKFNIYKSKFSEELSNDLNTSNTITIIYDLLKDDSVNDVTKRSLIEDFDRVLSLDLLKEKDKVELDSEILSKIEERNEAKKNRDFTKADAIRDELLSKGIKLIDSREGTTYELI